MKTIQIKTPEDLLAYIMHEYESTGAFTLRELDAIRDSYEEWAIACFDDLRNLRFKNLGKMISDGIHVLRATRIMSVEGVLRPTLMSGTNKRNEDE